MAPGLGDLHTRLREPGKEEAETGDTGARAAALGGFTCGVAMPNTEPPIDSAAVAREVLERRSAASHDDDIVAILQNESERLSQQWLVVHHQNGRPWRGAECLEGRPRRGGESAGLRHVKSTVFIFG